jgi:hypothetical protein
VRTRALILTVFAFLYWGLRRLLELLGAGGRDERAKDVEILGSPPRAAGAQAAGRSAARTARRSGAACGVCFGAAAGAPAVVPRAAGNAVALAPRARRPPLDLRGPRSGTAAAGRAGAGAGVAPSSGEPELGLQAHPRRARWSRDRSVTEQRLEHPPPPSRGAGAAAH